MVDDSERMFPTGSCLRRSGFVNDSQDVLLKLNMLTFKCNFFNNLASNIISSTINFSIYKFFNVFNIFLLVQTLAGRLALFLFI